jgi:hypothetical protein
LSLIIQTGTFKVDLSLSKREALRELTMRILIEIERATFPPENIHSLGMDRPFESEMTQIK